MQSGPATVPADGTPSGAKWDGSRVLFEIVDGDTIVACAISREALREVSGRNYGKPAELLACFAKSRARIEGVARAKHRAQPSATGLLIVWAGDLDDHAPVSDADTPS
jgi:hypothetical protein